ncbi:hypothetical protein Lfu02_20080 [Longispora fulva]|uniref:Cell wall-associated NlpC family hydrolase n=1 Tax=Longispora fulva TaxID=619741 RepID=A0A8J7GUW8_9ACTN|nr:C40 family peptidase [Longispora fulva]MBG6139985.1 cell wall-associated NlpC family hydrolase [Longispora fulva]GIG57636.1 hypothetical protein Lfu02_20080 [Longispora fulva]
MKTRKTAWFFLCALIGALAFATPSVADPGNPATSGSIPDPGVRPPLPVPGAAVPTVHGDVDDPAIRAIEARVNAEAVAVRLLEQQALAAQITAESATESTTQTKESLDAATAILTGWEGQASDAAAASYREAQALEPLGPLGKDLRDLSALAPGMHGQKSTKGQYTAKDFLTAQHNQQAAQVAYDKAVAAQRTATTAYTTLKGQYDQRLAALTALRAEYSTQLTKANADKFTYELNQTKLSGLKPNSRGELANPKALEAVAWAKTRLGRPYVFGADGRNNTFDCSGLVQWSYKAAGVSVTRIANDQYHTTKEVDASQLLPGDLLFYNASPSRWEDIYHVVIYIGDNKVIQAPEPGDVVKISPVSTYQFYRATRVVDAVTPPKPTPSPSPSPTPTPTPSPSPSPTPSPSPSPSPSPTSTTPPVTPTDPPVDTGTGSTTPTGSGANPTGSGGNPTGSGGNPAGAGSTPAVGAEPGAGSPVAGAAGATPAG